MRISLIYNPGAGDGSFRSIDFVRLFSQGGHKVELFGKRRSEVRDAVKSEPDVLAVAGGDGTVAKAAIATAECGATAPLFILPAGTSNNIARSLGITGPIAGLIRTMAKAETTRLDIPSIRSDDDERCFVEGAGLGFIGSMLAETLTPAEQMARTIRQLVMSKAALDARRARGVAELIRHERVRPMELRLDGVDMSGDYLSVEIMNIREIGPGVKVAPDADFGDGLLDVVLVLPAQREAFARHVETRVDGPPPVTRHRAASIEMNWPSTGGHVDDSCWPVGDDHDGGPVTISVPRGISVLI